MRWMTISEVAIWLCEVVGVMPAVAKESLRIKATGCGRTHSPRFKLAPPAYMPMPIEYVPVHSQS